MLGDELSILRVEGKDDKHVIASLLKRHCIDPKAIDIKCSQDADDDSGGKDRLLRGMKTLVATSTGRSGSCRMLMALSLTAGEPSEIGLKILNENCRARFRRTASSAMCSK